MNSKRIHIVSLDVPFPPDYGGVIDIYYRAKQLKEAGYYIVIHCFEYGRGRAHDFSEIAHEVFYYARRKRVLDLFSSTPFIVNTRNSEDLKNRLLADSDPILLEGQHCSSILSDARFKNRKIIVRIHNIEHAYYSALSTVSTHFFKRLFFKLEAWKLRKHENTFLRANALICLSKTDETYYSSIHPNVFFWQAHFPITDYIELEQQQECVLYHGNLSVEENLNAVNYLLSFWKSHACTQRLIIAGKNPPIKLQDAIKNQSHVTLVANPSDTEMINLLYSIPTHLLFTFQESGVKLKLYQSLLSGATCIVNEHMLTGTTLSEYCKLAVDSETLNKLLKSTTVYDRLNKRNQFITHELKNEHDVDYWFSSNV